MVSVCQQDQNALQRLLAFMLDEHCCSIGRPLGPHSLLLFGSEILTWETAVASASTKPQSSWSSSDLQLSDDERGPEVSLREPSTDLFRHAFSLGGMASWGQGAPAWFFNLDLMGSAFSVRSVLNNIHGCPVKTPNKCQLLGAIKLAKEILSSMIIRRTNTKMQKLVGRSMRTLCDNVKKYKEKAKNVQ